MTEAERWRGGGVAVTRRWHGGGVAQQWRGDGHGRHRRLTFCPFVSTNTILQLTAFNASTRASRSTVCGILDSMN